MYLGRVIGNVVSTIKIEHLTGMKLLVVERLDEHLSGTGTTEVAVDPLNAGNGEIVLVCKGSSARYVFGENMPPVDTSIVGIVENVEVV